MGSKADDESATCERETKLTNEYFAVHLVTESSDHYNLLVTQSDRNIPELVRYLQTKMGDEFPFISEYWISDTKNENFYLSELTDAINIAYDQYWDKEENE